MISFPQIPQVAIGDPVTAEQWNKMAAGINARLRAGVGDPTWRIHYYFLNLWRQVRSGGLEA